MNPAATLGSLGAILSVWAHPDDEAFLAAGLMAGAVRNGQRVACVTATRGEGGSWDEERWPSATMGAVREAEMLASLEILGVREHRWLDYVDGTCADIQPEEAIAKLEAVFRAVAPDSVLTFGPDGMTGHPDHVAISAWTTEAFRRVAGPGTRLFYATVTPEWAEEFVSVENTMNVFGPGTPPMTPPDELAINFPLPPEFLDLKVTALRAHESQVEGLERAFGPDHFRRAYATEFFRLAPSS